jgi:hypothetical protein
MSLPSTSYKDPHIKIDQRTGERVAVGIEGEGTDGIQGDRVIGPEKIGAIICDAAGRRASVSDDNAVRVDTSSGFPAAVTITGGDTYDSYVVVMVCQREIHNLFLYASGNDAVVSLDGGKTGHFYLVKGQAYPAFSDLRLPAGTQIAVKNADAANNFTAFYGTMW